MAPDVLKALALGADAVMIGRAGLYGLAAGGEAGACRAIEILRSEIDRGLGLLGCPDIATLGPAYVSMDRSRATEAGRRRPLSQKATSPDL